MNTGEPVATESGHDWFGGGPSEKDQVNWHLVGGLPYVQHGSGRGRRKRTHPTGTSSAAYFTRRETVRKRISPSWHLAARSTLRLGRRQGAGEDERA